jgi:peroxiredoxin
MVGAIFSADLKKAPNYKLKDINNKSIELVDALKKGPVVLNFWASWCNPCKEEMPELEELYKKYKDKGLQMHIVSIDKGSGISKAKAHVKSNNFTFDVLFDKGGKILKKKFKQSPNRVPYTFFINMDGDIEMITKDGDIKSVPLKGKQTIETFERNIKHILKIK